MLQKRSIALPSNVTLTSVADAARRAVVKFLVLEPSKPALAQWLDGPYAEATRFAPRRLVDAIDAIVASAQQEVRAAARMAANARQTEELVRSLPPIVHIVPAHDASGASGFIPVDAQGGRLADRVVALVLADYLTRPRDFAENARLFGSDASGARRTHPDAPTQPEMRAVRK
jgi:hypothetical protein